MNVVVGLCAVYPFTGRPLLTGSWLPNSVWPHWQHSLQGTRQKWTDLSHHAQLSMCTSRDKKTASRMKFPTLIQSEFVAVVSWKVGWLWVFLHKICTRPIGEHWGGEPRSSAVPMLLQDYREHWGGEPRSSAVPMLLQDYREHWGGEPRSSAVPMLLQDYREHWGGEPRSSAVPMLLQDYREHWGGEPRSSAVPMLLQDYREHWGGEPSFPSHHEQCCANAATGLQRTLRWWAQEQCCANAATGLQRSHETLSL